MNRILLWEETSSSPIQNDTLENQFDDSQLLGPRAERRRTSLFAPLHYERNYAYPLVIWLHGPDDDQRQLKQVMPLVSMRNYVAAGPHGTKQLSQTASGRSTYTWGDSEGEIVAAGQCVDDAVDLACSRFNVDRRQVFLAGYDAGGTMAIRVALQKPRGFAGVASFGGPFPVGHTPLVNIKQVRSLPLMVAHCRDSQSYDLSQMCNDLRLLHSAGMPVTLREYPCGQELTTKMLSDLDVWMMELVTGIPPQSSPAAFYELDDRN